jgi:hypothetical protein
MMLSGMNLLLLEPFYLNTFTKEETSVYPRNLITRILSINNRSTRARTFPSFDTYCSFRT